MTTDGLSVGVVPSQLTRDGIYVLGSFGNHEPLAVKLQVYTKIDFYRFVEETLGFLMQFVLERSMKN